MPEMFLGCTNTQQTSPGPILGRLSGATSQYFQKKNALAYKCFNKEREKEFGERILINALFYVSVIAFAF